ncbi:MAG: hypothetical protein MPJ25_00990 [Pirellulales bacterium]|nr:hypothetical protein [Pirellulales bacterium]
MTKEEFYYKGRNEPKWAFLGDLGIITYYIHHSIGSTYRDFMILLKLHSMGDFIKDDFMKKKIGSSYDNNKFQKFLNNGWVKVHRKRSGAKANYNIYRVTTKIDTIIKKFYRLLGDEEFIPETKRNPIFKDDFKGNKQYQKRVKDFNEELRERLRQQNN